MSSAKFDIHAIMRALRAAAEALPRPIVTELSCARADPFKILISTIISLRTKDQTTAEATARLFALAQTPHAMGQLAESAIARAIFPAGFYKTKARTIRDVCHTLVAQFGGAVPRDIDTLLTFKGVGRKTANLVLTLGHGLPGICVDTHVHRISNRWGYVNTRTPEETEFALRRKLPAEYWIPINDWLVAWGQHVCVPISPKCSQCPLTPWCRRRAIVRSR